MRIASWLLLAGVTAIAAADPAPREQDPSELNAPYDARFTFVRLRYEDGGDGLFGMGRRRGGNGPGWMHDYPRAERNLMHILSEISTLSGYMDGGNIIDIGDPELHKFPLAYMSEPGDWRMSDREAANLRSYLLKGGFLIFDDFPEWAWQNFSVQMQRVLPDARVTPLAAAHPVFHSFFEIESLDTLYPSYLGQPLFYGIFEDNDPRKRLMVVVNYRNDLGENWEYADTGVLPVDVSNEAYKFGVNYLMYALTH